MNVVEGDTGGRVYAAGFDRAEPRRERDEEGRILRGGGREGEGADAGERGGEFGRAGPVVVFADFDGLVVEEGEQGINDGAADGAEVCAHGDIEEGRGGDGEIRGGGGVVDFGDHPTGGAAAAGHAHGVVAGGDAGGHGGVARGGAV